MTTAVEPARLPRGVRIGYGSGSVATGAFGTVPGLMLLPYLTDELGIAAPDLESSLLEAGWVVVFFVLAASVFAFFRVPYIAMREAPLKACLGRLQRPVRHSA